MIPVLCSVRVEKNTNFWKSVVFENPIYWSSLHLPTSPGSRDLDRTIKYRMLPRQCSQLGFEEKKKPNIFHELRISALEAAADIHVVKVKHKFKKNTPLKLINVSVSDTNPLAQDLPSGMRPLYQRRKWKPPMLTDPNDEKKGTSTPARRNKANKRRETHSSLYHKERRAAQRKRSTSSIHIDTYDTNSHSVLDWDNPEGWQNWSDTPLNHPDVMPIREEKPSALQADVDATVQSWRLNSIKSRVLLREFIEKAKSSSSKEEENLLSSKSPEFHLVKKLDYKLQHMNFATHDMSRYERELSGLSRVRPKTAPKRLLLKKINDKNKNRNKHKKLKKRKITRHRKHQQLEDEHRRSLSPLAKRRIEKKEARQMREKQKYLKNRHSLTNQRTLTITAASLAESKQLRVTFLDIVRKCVHADKAAFWVYDKNNSTLWTDQEEQSSSKMTNDQSCDNRGGRLIIPSSSGIAGKCFTSGEAAIINNCYRNPLFNPKVDRQTGYKTVTMLVIPIHGATDGQPNLGCLQVINKKNRTGEFNLRDATIMQLMISILKQFIAAMSTPDTDIENVEMSKDHPITINDVDLLEEGLPQLCSSLNVLIATTSKFTRTNLKERYGGLRKEFGGRFDKKLALRNQERKRTSRSEKVKRKYLKSADECLNEPDVVHSDLQINVTSTKAWKDLQSKHLESSRRITHLDGWDLIIKKEWQEPTSANTSAHSSILNGDVEAEDMGKACKTTILASSNPSEEVYIFGARNDYSAQHTGTSSFENFEKPKRNAFPDSAGAEDDAEDATRASGFW